MSGRREWSLVSASSLLVACIEPSDWALPDPSPSARSVAIYLEDEIDPRVLLVERDASPRAYAVAGRPSLLAFSPRTLPELATPHLLVASERAACDRRRPIPVVGIEAYRGGPEDGWTPTSEVTALSPFSLPPLDLVECLKAGCVRRDEDGLYYCATGCVAPEAPASPERAACPEGWLDESADSARCRPPSIRSCATAPCWIFPVEPGEACEARAQPAGTERVEGPTLPAVIERPLWLPRGRYTGRVEVRAGGALLGECHQGTTIVGEIVLRGGARVSDLNLEVASDRKGIEIDGRGARVERVRIQEAEIGVLLRPSAQAEVHSSYVEDVGWGLISQSAELELRHFYVGRSLYDGIKLESSTGTISDLVVNSDIDYVAVAVLRATGEASPPPIRIDRAYVEGQHQIQFAFDAEVNARDLRSDGRGLADLGIQTSQPGSILELERAYFSDLRADAFWSREGATPRIRDLLVRRAGGGVLFSTPLQLLRARLEDLGGEALKLNGGGEVDLQDLTIIGAELGLRLTPDVDEPHRVRVSRALIEGCGVGMLRGPGQVELSEVLISASAVGVQAGACWIDEALTAVYSKDVPTPAVIEEP